MGTNLSKKHYSYTIKDFYKELRNRDKADGKKIVDIITYKQYRALFEDLFQAISAKIIYENFMWYLPYGLGSIYIAAAKVNPDNIQIDFLKTKKLGKVVRFLNRHTDGMYFRFRWNKEYVNFKNRSIYQFTAVASDYSFKKGIGKRALPKHIFDLAHDPEKRQYIKIR